MIKQAMNPYLPLDEYVPDGEPHVFGDRVYVFGSHDKEAGETFCMLPYVSWSAPVDDLSNWSCSGQIYSAKLDPLYDIEKNGYIYAPDAVQGNDGRYYLYYCLAGKDGRNGYSYPVSVAVCDKPDGKYEFYGHVKNKDGSLFLRYVCFDPAVINDDGQIRLYFGACFPFDEYRNIFTGFILDHIEANMFSRKVKDIRKAHKEGGLMGAFHVELEDDMVTVKGNARRLFPVDTRKTEYEGHGFFEASSIRKINGTYYFVYSSQNNHELCYATSDRPDEGFRFRGVIVSNGDIGFNERKPVDRTNCTGTNHGGIECINGKYYIFYHRLTHLSDFSRQGCAEEITIENDGSIGQVEITSCGLNGGPLIAEGTYPAAIACEISNGNMPHGTVKPDKKGIKKQYPCVTSLNDERFITDITDQVVIGFKYFDFDSNQDIGDILLTIAGDADGMIQIATEESFENIVGQEKISVTTSDWKEVSVRIKNLKGTKAIFIKFIGIGNIRFKEFKFKRSKKNE